MGEAGSRLFCFGYGYSCERLAQALQARGGWAVSGTTRDAVKKVQMQKQGVKAFIFDAGKPLNDPALFLRGVTHLLISAPPDDEGDPVFLAHGEDILHHPSIRWIGYLSSSSVYGDRGGDWVDEKTEAQPSSKRGSRRAKAEEQWLSLYRDAGLPVHVFRLAGIYGPGRSALDSVRAGMARRIEKPGHVFSRIHVDDVVQIIEASMAKPHPGAIYNCADDCAAPSHEVIEYACTLLGVHPPPLVPFEEADLAPIARSFYRDNKRLRNDRIRQELGVKLLYPDYKTGLEACLAASQIPLSVAREGA